MHASVGATHDGRDRLAATTTVDRSAGAAGGQRYRDALGKSEVRELVVRLVERASSMRERLTSEFLPHPATSGAAEHASLDAWCASAAKGDERAFAHRLALGGLDRPSAERAVGRVSVAPGRALPEWARLIERYIHVLRDGELPESGGADDIPFVQLFAQLADIVERDLEHEAVDALRHVSRAVRQHLRTTLLRRLARSAAPIIQERFESYRARRATNAVPSPTSGHAGGAPRLDLFGDFVREMLCGGMVGLLMELPVLARVMATTALLWRSASAEFLLHLQADHAAIADFFDGDRAPGILLDVDVGLSDAHAGGRTVHLLTFASGLRLLYKPRGLGVDVAFEALLRWAVSRGAPLPSHAGATLAPRALDRGSHGWVEYVEHLPCADLPAVRRYYENAGSLLALLHALGSTDFHYENIVACGERPVIVDLETVLQPEIERADPPIDHARNLGARLLYDDSVLRTGLLPAWQSAGRDHAYDTGGLSASADQATPFTAVRWRAINSDAMRLEYGHAMIGTHPNLPVLEGRPVPPAQHVDDIVLGFDRMYRWLSAHRDALIASDGPVRALAREMVRFIARPSSVYDHVLRRSLRRGALHDGAARDIELELLARGLLQQSAELWPVLDAEQRSLAQMDIPVFTLPGDSRELALGEHAVRLARSGLDVARSRLSSLGPGDLERQLRIVRASFALRYLDEPVAASVGDSPPAPARDSDGALPLARAEIIAAAVEIAAEIGRAALVDCRGDLTWVTTEPISTAGHARLQATGYGLYDGLAGIALFLAAAARCSGDPQLASLARHALSPIRARLRSASQAYVNEYGIGGACGAGSAIYSLLRTGMLLREEAVVDDALHAARQLTAEAIEHDATFDVLYGCAGAALALLALYKVRRSDELLELAHRCGRHLLARRRTVRSSEDVAHHVWPTVGSRVHVGFAHGCAGIALALLRLHAATGITSFLDAALDAIRYEDSLLEATCCELPTSHHASGAPRAEQYLRAAPSNWCRGTAGVGLARLASLPGMHAAELRASAERVVAGVARNAPFATEPLDSACCGSMGAVELLLAAGLRWGDAGLLSTAHRSASEIVRRSRAAGRYRLSASPGAQIYDPSLYRGMAGIGYGLLRICHPEMLPSFLSWE